MNNFDNLAINSDVGEELKASAPLQPAALRPQGYLSQNSPTILAALLFCVYAAFFQQSISEWWFNPEWTTDDALQQIYPFHKAIDPELFSGDLITLMMEQYLTPLHWGVMWVATRLSGDPVMAGHWVMLVQLLLTVGFIFLAVREGCGRSLIACVPAFFACAWFLHTRLIIQRMTAGLPRGWAAPLFAAFLYFALARNHRAILITLLVGCVLHPPATLVLALTYGLWLCGEWVLSSKNRKEARNALIRYLLLSPVYCLIAWLVVRMPEEIGSMATLEVASRMPEFSTPDGRFPFYPLKPVSWEIATFGFQAFLSRLYQPYAWIKSNLVLIISLSVVAFACVQLLTKRTLMPSVLWSFLVATFSVYFLSRLLAFKLYVPDRHLQFPMAMFFIVGFSIAAWQLADVISKKQSSSDTRSTKFGVVTLSCVALLVFLGSGSGLQGSANFNYSTHKKGGVFDWIRANTARDALIAGEPSMIDGVMLFGQRKAYITTETAHPFYDRYYAQVKPRIETTLRAHYSRSLNELLSLLGPEGVDYFVFERRKFYPEALKKVRYFEPFNGLVRELAARDWREYAFRQLPRSVNVKDFPPMPFRDENAVVVDIRALQEWIEAGKSFPVPEGNYFTE